LNKAIFSAIIIFIVSFLIVYYNLISINHDRFKTYLYEPDNYNTFHEQELNLIFIGHSKCIYSNDKELFKVIDELKAKMYVFSKTNNLGFNSIGITTDADLNNGMQFLKNFGPFDELSYGNGWRNAGCRIYINEMRNEISTPQLLVTLKSYSNIQKSFLEDEKLVLTLNGKEQIIRWNSNGGKLPKSFISQLKQKEVYGK
jgi:hypothetical protein